MTDPEAELERHLEVVAAARSLLPALRAVGDAMIAALAAGGRIWTFGNGGSAAEAQHFATELAGRYRRARRPLAAVSLASDSTLITCIGNDYSFDDLFARQVEAAVSAGDVVVAFTTSGESENVVRGMAAARKAGATTVLLTGESAGGGSGIGGSSIGGSSIVGSSSGDSAGGGGSATGGSGGRAREQADHALVVPASETARIQEVHLLFLHLLSEQIDAWAAG